VQTLRLIDSFGYIVPAGIRYCVPDDQVEQVTENLLTVVAPADVARWPENQLCEYRVTTD